MPDSTISVPAHYYRQFDADLSLEVPAEGYGGWKKAPVAISREHTAVVVMHAWDTGTPTEYPGWYRAVEYMPRANEIGRTVFPRLLSAVRAAGMTVLHVVGGGDYYKGCPGYRRALELAGPTPPPLPRVEPGPAHQALSRFREQNVYPGPRNGADISRGFAHIDFMASARPVGDEGVAENDHQLAALATAAGTTHLVYAGFAINWCLLSSSGGMADMDRRGFMCSAFREAVTAVENRETARKELAKELGLWRVALAFGFVFEVGEFVAALGTPR
jgi:hypothetical protein